VCTAHRTLSTEYSVPSTQYSVRSAAGRVVPGIASIMILAALTLPGTSAWAVGLAWFVLAAAECLAWFPAQRLRRPTRRPAQPVTIENEPEGAGDDEAISAALVQSLTRERTDDGGEALHALVRADCEAGDRVAVVHLAFCPPLAAAPELAAHVLDDSGAEARIALAQPYGARIELRLPQPATAGQTVLVEVVGTAAKAT